MLPEPEVVAVAVGVDFEAYYIETVAVVAVPVSVGSAPVVAAEDRTVGVVVAEGIVAVVVASVACVTPDSFGSGSVALRIAVEVGVEAEDPTVAEELMSSFLSVVGFEARYC